MKKDNGSNTFWILLIVSWVIVFFIMPFGLSALVPQETKTIQTGQSQEEQEEVPTETEQPTVEEEPAQNPRTVADEDLFVSVYKQGVQYEIVWFVPTDTLYVVTNDGAFVQLTDSLGRPLKYKEYLKLIEKPIQEVE